jgi:hypothetical protein
MLHHQSFVADCHNRYIKYKCCFKYTFRVMLPILIMCLVLMCYIGMELREFKNRRNITEYHKKVCEYRNKIGTDCEKIYSPDLTQLDDQIEIHTNIVIGLGIVVIISAMIVGFIDRMSFL